MKPPRPLLLFATALTFLAASCGDSTAADEATSLSGTHWLLQELGGASPVEATSITASFSDDGRITGTAGCNRYMGTYAVDGDSIELDGAAATRMACEGPVMAQEQAYFEVLSEVETYSVNDGHLVLEADGEAVARFAPQSQELAGTQWQILMYSDGQSAVVGVLDGTEPTVEFGEDETLSGTAGCNRFSAEFTATEGTLSIGAMEITEMFCGEPEGVMEQEAAITAALQSAAVFVLEADSLTLRTADDEIALQLGRQTG